MPVARAPSSTGPQQAAAGAARVQLVDVQAVERLGRRSQGLVTSAQLAAAGVGRWAQSRAVAAGRLVRVRRGVYALSPLPPAGRFLVTATGPDPAYVAAVRALLLHLGGGAVAGTRTAAVLFGWGLLVEPTGTLEVAVRHGWDLRLPGVRATQRRIAGRALVAALPGTVRMRVTPAVQTVLDCAAALPLLEAVVVCDSALRSGRVSVDDLVRAAARLPGQRAAAAVREVLALCDEAAGSVLESVMRVRMVQGGLTGFTTQAVLATAPTVLRVDFCFAAAGLVVEVDGARWHQDPHRDQERDNRLAALGWRVLRFTWAEVVHDPERVLQLVREALAATTTVHLVSTEAEPAA